jgi:hypothetical protein
VQDICTFGRNYSVLVFTEVLDRERICILLFQCRSKTKDQKITDYDSVNCLYSIQQFAAAGVPLPVGGQYVLIEPGASPVLYVTRSETEDNKPDGGSGGGFGGAVLGFINSLPFPQFITNLPFFPSSGTSETTTTAAKPDETPTEKTPTRNPEKVRTPKPKEN